MLSREEFYFLYVNCNSLAELGLKQSALALLRAIEAKPQQEPVTFTDEEIAARLQADFEAMQNMDPSAFPGLNMDFFSAPPASEADSPDAGVPDPLGMDLLNAALADPATLLGEMPQPAGEWPPGELNLDDASEAVNVAAYMSRAYNYEELLRERLDRYYQRADLAELASLLAASPELPALTQRLTAEQMDTLLALYDQRNDRLGDLVVTIRQLDMGGPSHA